MSASVRVPVQMSVEEFLEWEPGDGRQWQLVDGEPQAMAPAKVSHGALQNEVGRLTANHLVGVGSLCRVIANPGVIPSVRASHNMRIPDVAVTCAPYADEESGLADSVLVTEVLSVCNRHETWANVWTYASIPSVAEILVVHTVTVRADLLRRQADGSWPAEPVAATAGDLVLDSIGFRAPLAAFYRTTRLAP